MGGDAAEKKCGTRCELWGGVAVVHCVTDSAFLCVRCDARVHRANFLASRCGRTRANFLPGAAAPAGSASSASSSYYVSTADSTESTAAALVGATSAAESRGRKQRARAEAVLEGWAKRMGFAPGVTSWHAAAAAGTLRVLGRSMAAALWSKVSSAAGCKGGDTALLCRLEATAHVPTRLVLTVASWTARAARSRPESTDGELETEDGEHNVDNGGARLGAWPRSRGKRAIFTKI